MSIARPQNRDEFRQYVLTKLGAPVTEINVADEQIDIAIEDAFQYFNERSHFLGTERMYLTFRMTSEFLGAFDSFRVQEVSQQGGNAPTTPIPGRPTESAAGMVAELTLVSPGKGYPSNAYPLTNQTTTEIKLDELEITTQSGDDIQTQSGLNLVYSTAGLKTNGTGLSVNIGAQRTTTGGITNVSIYDVGNGYEVGDIVTISGGSGTPALFEVSKIKTESPMFGTAPIQTQNNYLVLPDDVVSVQGVLQSQSTDMTGIFPGGSIFPMMLGGMLGNDQACGDVGYNLVSYVAMREYMATLEFLFFPPIQYNFNQRTHRLFVDTNNFNRQSGAGGGVGSTLCLECMVKPSPDVYPDLWNDLWIKKYCVALVKSQWGRNLTKYNQVNLPGGITMNGDQILQQGREDVKELEQRFAMDWADPVLDLVG
jgi:hypothetical protein